MAFAFAALTLLITLAGQAGDPPSLVGPTWVAVDLAGTPVPAEPAAQQPTIQFVANGRAAGTDGCNRVSVPYTQNGERITFGPMIATRMACPGSDDVQRRFAEALAGTTGWRIFTLSMLRRMASLPVCSSLRLSSSPPNWAIASTIRTPGMIGVPG